MYCFPYGLLSKIDSSSPFAPTTPGEYLLAIHPFFSEPLDGGAFMIGSFVFDDGTYFDLTGTVDEWNGANIEEGNYEIALDGVSRCMTVGGESLPVDASALMLGGIQSSAMWMLPVLAGTIGTSVWVILARMQKE